jgi:hypothetical protein
MSLGRTSDPEGSGSLVGTVFTRQQGLFYERAEVILSEIGFSPDDARLGKWFGKKSGINGTGKLNYGRRQWTIANPCWRLM